MEDHQGFSLRGAQEGRSFLELEEGQAVRGGGQEDEPGKEGGYGQEEEAHTVRQAYTAFIYRIAHFSPIIARFGMDRRKEGRDYSTQIILSLDNTITMR